MMTGITRAFPIFFWASIAAASPQPAPALHYSDRQVEDRLRAWLGRQDFASVQGEAFLDMSELKDAVASPPAGLRADIIKAKGSQRRLLAERLPGMSPEPFDFCRVLEGCPSARISFHVDEKALIQDAAAALVRPWIILEKARGGELYFEPAREEGDRTLDFYLKSLPGADLSLHVSPAATGGYDLWLTGLEDPAGLFRRARASVLPSDG